MKAFKELIQTKQILHSLIHFKSENFCFQIFIFKFFFFFFFLLLWMFTPNSDVEVFLYKNNKIIKLNLPHTLCGIRK